MNPYEDRASHGCSQRRIEGRLLVMGLDYQDHENIVWRMLLIEQLSLLSRMLGIGQGEIGKLIQEQVKQG